MTQPTIDELTSAFVSMRAKIKEIEARHKEELAPFKAVQDDLSAAILGRLHEVGASSVKTPHGTPHIVNWSSAKVADWTAVLDFVKERDRWDLLTQGVSKTVAEEIGDVPGVVIERGIRLGVRASS